MNSLLRFSLDNISLQGFLDCALNTILSVPAFSLESKGAIYLVEDQPRVLVLKAHKRLRADEIKILDRVSFDSYVCGRAASTFSLCYEPPADSSSKRGSCPVDGYGHYCVPIRYAGKILGVLDIYLQAGHKPQKMEEDFLNAVSITLAGVIQRKKNEELISKINEGFINLVADPLKNIESLVKLCGDILSTGFIFYGRALESPGFFVSTGRSGVSLTDRADIEACKSLSFDLALKNPDGVFIYKELPRAHVNSSKNNGNHLLLKACMGSAIDVQGSLAGVLCVFYRVNFEPDEREKKLLGIIVSALIIEEERIKASGKLREAYDKLEKAQDSLVQSEKLAALGRFSSGVAHEVKNPLGIVLGGVEFLSQKLKPADAETELAMRKIKEATLRADGVVRNLLRFSLPSELTAETIDPGELLEDTIQFFKYRASVGNVKIEMDSSKRGITIKGDKNQLQQVLFNVMMNAAEAIEKKGKISIKLRAHDSYDGFHGRKACLIEIRDTGSGISEQDLPRMFEPFFTTKRDKKGTGLGLFISKMIVENHGGRMVLDSRQGAGTCVTIVVPAD